MTSPHEVIHGLEAGGVVPTPFDLDRFIAQLGAQRARPIRLGSFPAHPSAPCGLLISTRDTDYVLYAWAGSSFYRDHVITHELGHLLLEHPGQFGRGASGGLLDQLMPHLDPALITRVLGRGTYDNAHERDAELFATLMLAGRYQARTARTAGDRRPDDGVGPHPHQGHWTPDDEGCRRSLDRLFRLWATLTGAVPGVVLRTGDARSLSYPAQRLHRCLVEINDALLVLAPHRDPRGVAEVHLRAVAEAAAVSTALSTCTGHAAPDAFTAMPGEVSSPPVSLEGEVRRVELLARELQQRGVLPETGERR